MKGDVKKSRPQKGSVKNRFFYTAFLGQSFLFCQKLCIEHRAKGGGMGIDLPAEGVKNLFHIRFILGVAGGGKQFVKAHG